MISFFIRAVYLITSIAGSTFLSTTLLAENYQQQSVSYDFEDISTTGTVLIQNCDDCARALDIGFEFTYFGRVYTQLYVGANGFVLPGGSAPLQGERMACCDGRDIPWKDNMAGIIALWWTDLSLKAQENSSAKEEDGKIFYELQGNENDYVLIVQFNKVRHFHNLATDDASTFQLKIFQSNNHIEFHYKNILANQNIHTIGIESPKQDQGVKYFRTSKTTPLPSKTKNFAIAFVPSESVKVTSSLRYGAAGNSLSHIFEVDQNIGDMSEISFSQCGSVGSFAEDIFCDSAILLANNPARFEVEYTLFDSLSGEKAGDIFGDIIDFQIEGGDFLSVESQTVLIGQSKLIDDDEAKVIEVAFNHNATILSYKSKNNLLGIPSKSALANDVFFVGRDPDTLAGESYQLTRLSATDECGPAYIDDGENYSDLYVICTTGGANKEVELIRYDLDSYLDDDLTPTQTIISGSTHEFSGSISQQALVVSGSGIIAYGRDVGAGQEVIFNGSKVNTVNGLLKSLAIDNTGTKLVYVLDNTLYFYDGSETIISSEGVESAHISADGSLIVFNSTSDALDASDNSDNSLEIFTVSAQAPFTMFQQKTSLALGGICKLPSLSEKGQRIIVVCNDDLLNLGNDFTDREGVFVIDTFYNHSAINLITAKANASQNISRLTMSSDGASVVFQDVDEENAFSLAGLSKLDSRLEENTGKNYPNPFKLSGDGKSGIVFYINIFLLLILLVRKKFYSFK